MFVGNKLWHLEISLRNSTKDVSRLWIDYGRYVGSFWEQSVFRTKMLLNKIYNKFYLRTVWMKPWLRSWHQIQRKQLYEVLKIKKEIKKIIPESNGNHFSLLDLQNRLLKEKKKFVTRINKYWDGSPRNTVLCFKIRKTKLICLTMVKMEHVVILHGSFWIY